MRIEDTEATRFRRAAFFLVATADADALTGAAGKLRASPCARGCRLPFAPPHPQKAATSVAFHPARTQITRRPRLMLPFRLPDQVLPVLRGTCTSPSCPTTPCHAMPRYAATTPCRTVRLRRGCLVCPDHVAWRAAVSVYLYGTCELTFDLSSIFFHFCLRLALTVRRTVDFLRFHLFNFF